MLRMRSVPKLVFVVIACSPDNADNVTVLQRKAKKCTCTSIGLLIKLFAWWRSCCRCRPGLYQVPNQKSRRTVQRFKNWLHLTFSGHFDPWLTSCCILRLDTIYELNKMTSLPMCGFIAELVEHRTGIAKVTGSNPVEALVFFRLLLSNCLNWKINCDDHSSLSSTTAVQIWIISYILHPYNRPRSIYQYSNMALRLSGRTLIFGAVFFVSKYILGI